MQVSRNSANKNALVWRRRNLMDEDKKRKDLNASSHAIFAGYMVEEIHVCDTRKNI